MKKYFLKMCKSYNTFGGKLTYLVKKNIRKTECERCRTSCHEEYQSEVWYMGWETGWNWSYAFPLSSMFHRGPSGFTLSAVWLWPRSNSGLSECVCVCDLSLPWVSSKVLMIGLLPLHDCVSACICMRSLDDYKCHINTVKSLFPLR